VRQEKINGEDIKLIMIYSCKLQPLQKGENSWKDYAMGFWTCHRFDSIFCKRLVFSMKYFAQLIQF